MTLLTVLTLGAAHGQTSSGQELSLTTCKEEARANFPAIKQYDLVEKSREMNVSNASKAWMPKVSLTGFGTAFTDIVDLPQQASQIIGEMKNGVYGASLSIQQVIYDGGAIAAKKRMQEAQADVSLRLIDVNLYEINERIEQLFFGILMLDEQAKQNHLLQEDLALSENTVRSLMNSGMANQGDLDAVRVTQIQVRQQELSIMTTRQTYLQMLSLFIAKELGDETTLALPDDLMMTESTAADAADDPSARPEMLLYASQEKMLDAQKKTQDAQLRPTLSAFGIGSAHNEVLSSAKSFNAIGGISLTWNIGALYTRRNDVALIENQRAQVATQRETFLFNNKMENRLANGTIESLRQQMALDDEAIALRESIRQKAEKKVQNGTETVNELLRDVNAVNEARQQKAIHKIQLLQEAYRQKTLNNN